MAHCENCSGERIMSVSGKCSDLSFVEVKHLGLEHQGYVPMNLNIGSGDYLEFDVCLDCGHMQGKWPEDDSQVKDCFEGEKY